MINKITSILGIMVILAASASVFLLDKIDWWNSLAGIFGGSILIYVKSAKFTDIFKMYLDKRK